MLMLLGLATGDAVTLLRAQLRVDMAAQGVGQLASQCNRIVAPADINAFWTVAQRSLGSVGTVTGAGAQGAVIVSAVGRVGGANRVAWQQRTGSTAFSSAIGGAGAGAALPGGFQVPDGQTLFVTEVFLPRATWQMSGVLMGGGQRTLRSHSMFMTRASDAPSLQQPPAASTQPACTA